MRRIEGVARCAGCGAALDADQGHTCKAKYEELWALVEELVSLEDADGGRTFPTRALIARARAALGGK